MIGEHVRTLRRKRNVLLRELASKLNIDSAMLSKMERGIRSFRKEDIEILSLFFKQGKKELYTMWLADKILKTTENENYKKEALKLAINSCRNDE